jgi:hypothetical protein
MKKVSLFFASVAMVAFVACNNAAETAEEVTVETEEVVEETVETTEEVVEEVVDTTEAMMEEVAE